MDLYTISAVKDSTNLIKGIKSSNIPPGVTQLISRGSGAVDNTFISIGEIRPEFNFTTSAVKTALNSLGGIEGKAISNLTWFLQKYLADGKRAGDLSHIKIVGANGLIVPTAIRAVQSQEAVIDYRAIFRSADGTTSPLAFTADQSLEAGQDSVSEIYTLGPVSLNGIPQGGIVDFTINFGWDIFVNIVDGKVYPTEIVINTRSFFITITTRDVSKFSTWGLAGQAQGVTDSTLQLLDQTEAGVRGTSPITFSIDAGSMMFTAIPGPDGTPIAATLTLTPTYDGVADPIVISGLT